MKNLESKTEKSKKPNTGRRKKVSINDLNKHDKAFYQEKMEELLQERGIFHKRHTGKIKKEKG